MQNLRDKIFRRKVKNIFISLSNLDFECACWIRLLSIFMTKMLCCRRRNYFRLFRKNRREARHRQALKVTRL